MSDEPNPHDPGSGPLSAYRKSLLDTDARILAEDGDHVVVALRLRKDVIRRNLSLLGAIVDLIAVPANLLWNKPRPW